MVVIAVAGGTGGVGKTIVERLVEESKFEIVVLTRSDPCNGSAQQVQINYEDIPSATRALERHNVHTIISAIGLVSEDTSQSQLNLIEAAEQSKTTERFIPSEFSFIQTADLLHIDPSIKWWLDAADSLKASSLQYTRVIPGFFMDYWGMPLARTNLQPYTFGVSLSHRVAIIPGDGNNVICMTYTYDMAKYVARLLELDEWPEFSVIVGDQVTYNQLLEMAEEIRGGKFEVTYNSAQRIAESNTIAPPMPPGAEYPADEVQEVTTLVNRLIVNDVFDLPRENRLNDRFPDVQPLTMREFLQSAWQNK